MKIKFSTILLILGIALIVASCLWLFFSQMERENEGEKRIEVLEKITEIIPTHTLQTVDDRIDKTMPVMEIENENYCGIFSFDKYQISLPIAEKWHAENTTVSRFYGSIYDGTLILGGEEDYLPFSKTAENGDEIKIIDMTGGIYKCKITKIIRSNDVSSENLLKQECDLLLFIKNTLSLDYTFILCEYSI